MRHSMFVLALLVAAPLPPAAAQTTPPGPSAQQDTVAPLPSVTLPADLDRVLRDYERAWKAGDGKALADLFAIDGFVLQGGRMPVRGRAAIRALYTGQAGGELKLRAFAYAVSDTIGYMVGGYAYGENPNDVGKWTLTLRRDRGGPWQIMSDMDNQNRPARRPNPSPGSGGSSPP